MEKNNGAEGFAEQTEKKTKRQLQALKTKDKIYDAAVHEFNERGFNNVSIEDITRAAKVAKGSFYTHFQSKEDLALYSYVRADAAYQKAYDETKGQDYLSRMLNFLCAYYEEFGKHGKGLMRALITSYYAVPGNNYYNKGRVLLQCFAKIAEQGKGEGDLDPDILTDTYVSMFLSALIGIEVIWCYDNSGIDLVELIRSSMKTMALGRAQQYREKRQKTE